MVHIPGIRHRAADCISRHPTGEPEQLFLDEDVAALHTAIFELMSSPGLINKLRTPSTTLSSVEEHVIAPASSTLDMLSLRPVTWERVRTATASDDDMHALVTIIDTKGLLQLFNEDFLNGGQFGLRKMKTRCNI